MTYLRATGPDWNSHSSDALVAGEMHGDWVPRPSQHGSDALPPGVYAYKRWRDGGWAIDVGARTRSRAGIRNQQLVVGGTPEPVLFANGAPFVREEDDGGVTITAGLRHGSGESLEIRWSEAGNAEQATSMRPFAREDEHTFYRGRLPWSAERARFHFALDGAPVGDAFEHRRSRASERAPSWWRSAVVYGIFVDRFRPADDRASFAVDPGPDVAAGGHLDGVTRSLDELAALGATALYLTPIHVAASCHRYDLVDPLRVDPALGGEEAFARLIAAAHARGMRVIVDLAITHAGRGFEAYEDVLRHGRASPYARCFRWTDEGALLHYGKRSDAPLLALEDEGVRAMAMAMVDGWAERGVDGLRLDAAADVPIDLARAMRARLRAARPEAIVVGEVVPAHAWRWIAAGAIDAATDFGFHGAVTEFVARGGAAQALERALETADLARGGGVSASLRFVSTHDHARLSTLARASGRSMHAPLAHVLLLTSPGVPAILYGEEVGLAADVAELEPEGAWPDRAPMPWDDERRDLRQRALVQRLLALRAASAALRDGDVETLFAEERVLVYRRAAGGETIDVAVNAGDAAVAIEIADPDHPSIEPLVSVGEATARAAQITLGPASAMVIRRSLPGRPRARLRVLQLDASERRDRAFGSRAHATAAAPTRIDLAISESCNMRCRHCITEAPSRTASGTARTLSPWLLDRLRDAFAFAEYVGFVHGGEPMAAPIFDEVLRAIRSARAGFPTVVHLLTNGILLREATAARIADLGVSSISVSLDGARAASNDAVRDGGRFDLVTANVRAVSQLRKRASLDLRLGISSVVLSTNRDELEDLVVLAADLGVDWLKLEEAVPVNAFARRSLVAAGDSRTRDAVARAMARGRELGVVVVDHTAPPPVFRCKLDVDDAMRDFVHADEYANRSLIHPCRSTWERACIEADGGVRIGDFFAPLLGNLADKALEDLWNGPVAVSERLAGERNRPCASGAMSCIDRTRTRGGSITLERTETVSPH